MKFPTRAHLVDLIRSIRIAMQELLNAGRMKGADELREELAWYHIQLQRVAEHS